MTLTFQKILHHRTAVVDVWESLDLPREFSPPLDRRRQRVPFFKDFLAGINTSDPNINITEAREDFFNLRNVCVSLRIRSPIFRLHVL